MTAYPVQMQTTLKQLCAALWDSQSRLYVMQPGFEPGTVVTPLALRCSALDLCATREPKSEIFHSRKKCLHGIIHACLIGISYRNFILNIY
jgi:hypothetical protein